MNSTRDVKRYNSLSLSLSLLGNQQTNLMDCNATNFLQHHRSFVCHRDSFLQRSSSEHADQNHDDSKATAGGFPALWR